MFLVHDDETEVPDGREDRAARSHHHARLARADTVPLVVALPVGERRVEDGDARAEASREPAHRLGRERDLGDEDDRALPRLQDVRDGL